MQISTTKTTYLVSFLMFTSRHNQVQNSKRMKRTWLAVTLQQACIKKQAEKESLKEREKGWGERKWKAREIGRVQMAKGTRSKMRDEEIKKIYLRGEEKGYRIAQRAVDVENRGDSLWGEELWHSVVRKKHWDKQKINQGGLQRARAEIERLYVLLE